MIRKLILIGALAVASLGVSALDNEDCQFQDALNQPVTEVAVSCADKRAEYSYTDRDGNPATLEIDLMTPYGWEIDFESLFPGEILGNVPGIYAGKLEGLIWSAQPEESCNATDFIWAGQHLGTFKFDAAPVTGQTYINKIENPDEPEGYDTYERVVYTGTLPFDHLACFKYSNNGTDSYYYTVLAAFTGNASSQYGIFVSNELVDTVSPLLQAKDQIANKYYGELRAVPVGDGGGDGDGNGDPIDPPPGDLPCEETNTCNGGR